MKKCQNKHAKSLKNPLFSFKLSQYFDPRLVSDEKDLVISQLKVDLQELRQNEQDYNELNIHYNNLNHKLMILLDEKVGNLQSYNIYLINRIDWKRITSNGTRIP